MSGKIFYTIGIGFASGIFIRSFFNIGFGGIGLTLVIGAGMIIAGWLTTQKKSDTSVLFLIGIAFLATTCGMWRMHAVDSAMSPFAIYEGEKVSVIGKIIREPEIRESMVQLSIAPMNVDLARTEYILVSTDRARGELLDLSYGDVVKVEGVLKKPESFETDTGRIFDYEGYLKAKEVWYTIGFADVSVEIQESGTFLGYVFKGKHAFMKSLERSVPEPHAGLGEGILLGVKRALGKELEDTFRETGIIHVVVLSGYNIMIVISFFMFFLSRLFFPKTRLGIGIGIIVLFTLLVGPSATVVRASVMAILLLIAQTIGKTYAILRALTIAGVGMLFFNPYLLVHDPGFQLSFLATLGLIMLAPHVEKKLTILPKKVGIRSIVAATIATQIFVLPILLYHTGMLSVVSIFVNAIVLPMVPVAMFLTFVAGLVGLVSNVLGMVVGYLAYLSLGYIIVIAQVFGALSFASFTVGMFSFLIVVVSYALLALLMHRLSKNEIEVIEKQNAVVNQYDGWTIEEGKVPETRNISGIKNYNQI